MITRKIKIRLTIWLTALMLIPALPWAEEFRFAPADVFAYNNDAADNTLSEPVVETDSRGNWVVVWHAAEAFDTNGNALGTGDDSDIFVAYSHDDGVTFNGPFPLNTTARIDLSDDFEPDLSTDGKGVWIAVWEARIAANDAVRMPAPDPDPVIVNSDIMASCSFDNGVTWTPPERLSDIGNEEGTVDSSEDASPSIATDKKGNWVLVWEASDPLDTMIGQDFDIVSSYSSDNGFTWSPKIVVNHLSALDAGDDLEPRVTTDEQGTWLCVWESEVDFYNSTGIDWDVYFARSTDNGMTWSDTGTIGQHAYSDSGDDRGIQVAAAGKNRWMVAWTSSDEIVTRMGTDEDVVYSFSHAGGLIWSLPKPLNINATQDYATDSLRQLTTDGEGAWYAVWTTASDYPVGLDADFDLVMAYSMNEGLTWSVPEPIATNATDDVSNEFFGVTKTGNRRRRIAVWNSQVSPGVFEIRCSASSAFVSRPIANEFSLY